MSFATRQIQPWTAAQGTYSSVRYNRHTGCYLQPLIAAYGQPSSSRDSHQFGCLANQVQPSLRMSFATIGNNILSSFFNQVQPSLWTFFCQPGTTITLDILLPTRYNHHFGHSFANQVQPSLRMFLATIDSSKMVDFFNTVQPSNWMSFVTTYNHSTRCLLQPFRYNPAQQYILCLLQPKTDVRMLYPLQPGTTTTPGVFCNQTQMCTCCILSNQVQP